MSIRKREIAAIDESDILEERGDDSMNIEKSEQRMKSRDRIAALLEDEEMAEDLAAYIDGSLEGPALERLQAMLDANAALAREVEELKRMDDALKSLGAEIMDEPIPGKLLDTLRKASLS